MATLFRITAYHNDLNISVILDSKGYFEKIWQFSSYLIQKGFKILEVSKEENIKNIKMHNVEYDKDHIFLIDCDDGKPEYLEEVIDGKKQKLVKVKDTIYIP